MQATVATTSRAPGTHFVTDLLTYVKELVTIKCMIRSFRHKGLQELFKNGTTARIQKTIQERCLRRLDALDRARRPEDMNIPGFDFHALRGKSRRYSVHVNGPWCMTFEFEEGDALRVDFEQYH
jgi:toxin HigB-1